MEPCSGNVQQPQGLIRVPSSPMHHSSVEQGGSVPAGSSPASFKSKATTPWAGTLFAVKLRTAVPFSVCVHRSCVQKIHVSPLRDVLQVCWNMSNVPGLNTAALHESTGTPPSGRTYRQARQACWAEVNASEKHNLGVIVRLEQLTSINTVPFSLCPLQYCAGWVALYVQSGYIGNHKWQRLCQWDECTDVNPPSEGRDWCPVDRILIDRDNFSVLKNGERFLRYGG